MKIFTKKQKRQVFREFRKEALFHPSIQKIIQDAGKRTLLSTLIEQKQALFYLATTRNRVLITDTQQKKLADATIGFFGLSVGSHAACAWTMLSRATHVKIADPDTIDPSNLNRIRVGWPRIGSKKIVVLREALREINPFMHIETLESTDSDRMSDFCRRTPSLFCIVDEIDDIEGKIALRKIARAMRVPLISAVDVGDNVLLDVERYDKNSNLPLFLDRLPGIEDLDVRSLSNEAKIQLIIKLVGLTHNSNALLASLLAIGSTVRTWPQLGSTAMIAGGIVATTLKRIVLGEKINSGRYIVDVDRILGGGNDTKTERNAHQSLMRSVIKRFGLR